MTCSYCGSALPEGAMFCGECGRSVAAKAAPFPAPRIVPVDPSTPAQASQDDAPIADLLPVVDSPPDVDPVPESPATGLDAELPPIELSSAPCAQCGHPLAASDIFCPNCGFVRQSAARTQPVRVITEATPVAPVANAPQGDPRPRDTAGYDPFPWGKPPAEIPRVPPVYDPPPLMTGTGFVPDADPPFGIGLDDEETHIVDRSMRGERFVLQFSTGESVSVMGTGLLGRNPVAEPGEYFDTVVTISDPGKSVSKTHLEFGQDAGAFWVSDRFSGNGTTVREPERPTRRCEPGKRYRIVRGTRVQIGEQFFIVS